jgi:CubicO group peptidase (beta-lactamase class C family)
LLQNDGTPGYALAITDRTGLVAFRGFGHLDLNRTATPTPETLYEIGSVGKSFTAVVLMQLAAEGRVGLHAPMADRLPLFVVPSAIEPITPHHLLTHTSGLPSGTDYVPSHYHELWQMRHARVAIPPGERYLSSNLGDKALGMLIEHVS